MSAFSNKTVLITGATGLMGSHIASFLLKENNVKIVALSRNKEKLERIYKEYIKAGRVKIIAQDASKPINDDIGCIDYISELGYLYLNTLSLNLLRKFQNT